MKTFTIRSGNESVWVSFKNSPEYLNGSLSILDCPTFTSESCSLLGQGIPNEVDNTTTCAFGLENSPQVRAYVNYNMSKLSTLGDR